MFISEQEKWYLPQQKDCWVPCKYKGGKCVWCGENGYCCSADATKRNLNGDCPLDSVIYIATKTKLSMHLCVAQRNGKI